MRPSYAACRHFLRKDFRVKSLFGKGAEGNGVDDGFAGDGEDDGDVDDGDDGEVVEDGSVTVS